MCILIPAVIGFLAWVNTAIVRTFHRRCAGSLWWLALSVLWLIGAMLGVWGGFFFEYQPSPHLRVIGFPVPAAFSHWEGLSGEEQWIDFITPAPFLFAASNIVVGALLAACVAGLAFALWRRREERC